MREDDLKLLGLAAGASAKEIKGAFRKLAREMHPDVSADPSDHELFKQVLLAYEALTQNASATRRDGPVAPPPSRQSATEWERLRSLCEQAVARLRGRSTEAETEGEATLAKVCDIAATMLNEALIQYEQATKRYSGRYSGSIRLSLLDVAHNFADASHRLWADPTDSVAANLAKGHLGVIGLSRASLMTGREALPADKERAAKAILSELTAALLAVGAIELRAEVDASLTPVLLEANSIAAASAMASLPPTKQ